MATREQIRQAVDLLGEVTADWYMPTLRVPLADLPLWVDVLDVGEMDLALRYDSRVRASVAKYFPTSGLLVVDAVADEARGLELPACPEGAGFGQSMRFPVDALSRLESFTSREQVA